VAGIHEGGTLMAWSFGDQPQLSLKWALALGYWAGFRGKRLVSAVTLMWAESGRHPGAWNENLDDDGNVSSTDRGLFQINDRFHPTLKGDNTTRTGPAYEVMPNAMYASDLSNRGEVFGAWAAYGGTRYLAFYPIVAAVWALRRWESRVPNVPRKFGG
jgi:hypothetical protein